MNHVLRYTISAAAVFLLGLFFLVGGCTQIDPGFRGVKVTFGEVDEKAGSIPEGIYFYNPFTTSFKKMDVRQFKWVGETNTYTKDIQQSDIKYIATVRLDDKHAHTMYKTVRHDWWNILLDQAITGNLKQVIGHYDAVDLIEHRGKATEEIRAKVAAALLPQHVILERVELVNIQYHKEFENAVEAKVVAVQRAVEEKNRTVQIEEKAKQQIISAEAQAKSMKIRADALISNPKLVEYEAVQKWDGKMPQYMMGNSVPFIQLTK